MKTLLKILIVLVSVVLLAILMLFITGNGHVLNGITQTWFVGESKPDIDDMEHFDLRKVEVGNYEPWTSSSSFGDMEIPQAQNDTLEKYETVALLIIRHDSVYFEKYWEGYTDTTYSNSFSMAKSFTSIAIGCAIGDGFIKDVHQKVGDFLPRFKEGENAKLEIEHLLQMRSGIPFGESYASPFGYMARAYYGDDLRTETESYSVEFEPGTMWEYEGGNTVILAEILEKATGKTLSEYFSEKVWQKVGARKPAFWNLDREGGLEKAFSAFYSNARDFARLGKLYLDSGRWEGQQIVPEDFVICSAQPVKVEDRFGEVVDWYGYQWWLGEHNGKPFFSARGMRGQYILVVPEDDLIVVKLGHNRPQEKVDHAHTDVYQLLDLGYELTAK
jgi:CubicO group peptidase (beta-lactamase class C family)